MKRHAIIGFGCAGYHAARTIRRYDEGGEIDVFDYTGLPPFNPMLTTYYASEKLKPEGIFPFGRLDEIVRQLRLNLVSDTVVRVDPVEKTVCTEDGVSRGYDDILIATGASALVPAPLKRSGKHIFLMRTLRDAELLRDHLSQNKVRSAIVVGGSMVGIKVAELLWERGITTTIADAASHLFPLAAYPQVAHEIQSRLEEKGLRFVFGANVSAIDEHGAVLADGTLLEADLVCLCIGTRANLQLLPNTDPVKDSAVAIGRGIIVNTRMETNLPGIYAAGDCCEGINLQTGKTAVIGLWANAGAQGACAGSNMAGVPAEYYGSILHNITHFFDMDFIGLGDPSLPGVSHRFSGSGYSVTAVMDGDALRSVNILGNYQISGILKNHLTKQLLGSRSALTPIQRGLLARQGLSQAFIDLIGGST